MRIIFQTNKGNRIDQSRFRLGTLPRKSEKIVINGKRYKIVEVTHNFDTGEVVIEVEEEKR